MAKATAVLAKDVALMPDKGRTLTKDAVVMGEGEADMIFRVATKKT